MALPVDRKTTVWRPVSHPVRARSIADSAARTPHLSAAIDKLFTGYARAVPARALPRWRPHAASLRRRELIGSRTAAIWPAAIARSPQTASTPGVTQTARSSAKTAEGKYVCSAATVGSAVAAVVRRVRQPCLGTNREWLGCGAGLAQVAPGGSAR